MARKRKKVPPHEALAEAIAKAKISKQKAAKRIKITPSELSQLLSGLRTPVIDKAARIQDVFGVDMRSWVR